MIYTKLTHIFFDCTGFYQMEKAATFTIEAALLGCLKAIRAMAYILSNT
jgi:hypothetical protein